MHEDLVGYLLGALDRDATERVETRLSENPELRQELDRISTGLQPLDEDADVDPPTGLADRTLRKVLRRRQPEPWAPSTSGPGRLTDLAVAACILMAISVVIFPALNQSRQQRQVVECSNHLRTLGIAMGSYADKFSEYFPFFSTSGPLAVSGAYAPILLGTGLVPDVSVFGCAGAKDDTSGIRSLDSVRALSSDVQRLSSLLPSMGGSYAYSLGFMEDGAYHSPRRDRMVGQPILTDRPARTVEGDVGHSNSPNHGGRGQNVVYADGHVKFLCHPEECPGCDNLFISHRNLVEPGRGLRDMVFGVSESRVDVDDSQY